MEGGGHRRAACGRHPGHRGERPVDLVGRGWPRRSGASNLSMETLECSPGVSSYPGKLGSRKPQRRGRAGGLLPFLGHLGFTPQRRRLRGGYDPRLLLSLVPAASSEMCSEAPASGREGGHRGQTAHNTLEPRGPEDATSPTPGFGQVLAPREDTGGVLRGGTALSLSRLPSEPRATEAPPAAPPRLPSPRGAWGEGLHFCSHPSHRKSRGDPGCG